MNYLHTSKVFITMCIFFTFGYSENAFSQYEQKLTIHGSAVYMVPNFIELNADLNSSSSEKFKNGFGFDGGVQYNANRFFSWMANARYYNNNQVDNDGEYNNIAFGAGFKINMAGRKRFNPYLFAEVNFNSVWFAYTYTYPGTTLTDYQTDYYLTMGGMGGLGFDFRFNDHVSMFIQSSAYYTHYEPYLGLYNQVGVRISLLKARTI